MYNVNISFPLKKLIGTEQTGQTTWGNTKQQHLTEALRFLTYDPTNGTNHITYTLPILQSTILLYYLLFLAIPDVWVSLK